MYKRHHNAANMIIHCAVCGASYHQKKSFLSHYYRKHYHDGNAHNELDADAVIESTVISHETRDGMANCSQFDEDAFLLWYGNKVGNPAKGRTTPTYVFPADIVTCIRGRFPDKNAGKYDNQYSTEKAENVYNVTWSDVTCVKWPAPPTACTKCGAKSAKKPY